MKRIIIIGISVVVVGLLGYAAYAVLAPRKSPAKTTSFSSGALDIKVEYSQPSKRGRLIFGEKKDGALQPYGEYWRLGANEPTKITFSKNITFGGKPLNAGTYRMYAVPGANTWQVTINSEIGFWGVSEPDHKNDVLTAEVPAGTSSEVTEQFVINFSEDSTQVNMDLAWDKALIRVPIVAQP